MTKTIEERALEAAEAYRQDSITNGDHPVSAGAYAESYRDGHLAAAKESEQEIAALRARVAELQGMVPKWVRTLDAEQRRALAAAGWKFAVEVVQTETSTLWMLYVPPSVARPPIPLPEETKV